MQYTQKAIFLHHIVTQYKKNCKEAGVEVGLGEYRAIAMFQAYEAYLSIQRLEWYQKSEEECCTDEYYFPLFYKAMRSASSACLAMGSFSTVSKSFICSLYLICLSENF